MNWTQQRPWERVLTVILVAAIIATVGGIVYVVQTPGESEKFTEFYILGPGGKAADYPREVIMGTVTSVITGVVNHEYETITYRMEIDIDGESPEYIGPFTLQSEEKWEQTVGFNATKTGTDQKVNFRLYRSDETVPYRSLHLWLDVKEK